MELKKGMYVRYTRGAINGYVPPRIAKIINKNNDLLKLDNNNEILESDIIGKPSFDLIDLIEVGDYVNGQKVKEIEKGDGYYYLFNACYDGIMSHIIAVKPKSDGYIKPIENIVTKEQFDSMKYVVERDK